MTSPRRRSSPKPISPKRPWAAGPLVLGAGTLVVLSHCGELRPDELECEHAMAHLLDCCPELVVDENDCEFQMSSCDSSSSGPILTEEDAMCIQELACSDIHARQLCEAVQERSGQLPHEHGHARLCD